MSVKKFRATANLSRGGDESASALEQGTFQLCVAIWQSAKTGFEQLGRRSGALSFSLNEFKENAAISRRNRWTHPTISAGGLERKQGQRDVKE